MITFPLIRMSLKMLRGFGVAGLVVSLLTSSATAQPVSTTPSNGEAAAAQNETWAVLSGGSLKATIEGWSRVSGWTVVWDNPVDYRIRASTTFQGGFEQAVAGLVDAIHQASPELTVTLYRGDRVLHVEDAARVRN